MSAFVTAGGGFLLAVLWFDLMFDVQVIDHRGAGELPEVVLGSICAYYARVTTAARPMNRLIAAVMVGTLVGIAVEIVHGLEHQWVAWVSLALALGPIALAGTRTVPAAMRLGGRGDTVAVQSASARAVLRQHVYCACSIFALVVLQLAGG
jgi:hypothetical protein